MTTERAILTGHCKDRKGLVAAITHWLAENNGNILHLDQHVEPEANRFFVRVEWDLSPFSIPKNEIEVTFNSDVGERLQLESSLSFSSERARIALFVSKAGHCLWDILARSVSDDWGIDIVMIVGNHPNFQSVADQFGIPFYYLPITRENKVDQEVQTLELLRKHQADVAVLARYMQILSSDFLMQFRKPVINIHHSFLPAFAGAKPYHQAYVRGVKLVGATAHYVTADLDEGPIIEQEIARVSHRDSIQDMVAKGKDLEKTVLSRAIMLHVNRQVIVHGNRTVVFT